QVLDLARFAAEYYVTSLGEVIRSALPGMEARLERVVALTPLGKAVLGGEGEAAREKPPTGRGADSKGLGGLSIVSEFTLKHGAAIRLADLRRRFGPGLQTHHLRSLVRDGLLEMREIATSAGPRPRLEERAILIEGSNTGLPGPGGMSPEHSGPRRGAAQTRLLEALRASGSLPIPQLL